MVSSIISSFCSSPCASLLLVKSAICTEKCNFVAALITHFLPSPQHGEASALRSNSCHTAICKYISCTEQGSQLKGTHQSEQAFQLSFCPNRGGCQSVLSQGSPHRQAGNADGFFKGKGSSQDRPQGTPLGPAPCPQSSCCLHPTIAPLIYQCKSPALLRSPKQYIP